MEYDLRPTLSACQVDGHFIFLDLQADRYFHLTPELEQVFARHHGGRACEESDVKVLVEHGILIGSHSIEKSIRPQHLPTPKYSAIEMPIESGRISPLDLAEVAILVVSTRRLLSRRRLHEVLGTVQQAIVTTNSDTNPAPESESDLLKAAKAFNRARLLVPIEPRCLLDSISLARFLARRDLPSNIVFGVTGDPFSAHCWVQVGSIVLNDTVGNTQSHQPILAV